MTIQFDKVVFDDSNPEPRCPCVLLVDTSGSMDGEPISELNAGLQVFKQAISQDDLAMSRVEVAIVTFGGIASITQDFVTVNQFSPPTLVASGDTPMGTAINLALDQIDARKRIYRERGIAYFRPWVFLITDGGPTDGDVWKTAAQRVHQAESEKKVAFFAVGVGGANMGVLQQIAKRQPLRLSGLNFREMFVWLSSSLGNVSHSNPNDDIPLQSPMGWGSI